MFIQKFTFRNQAQSTNDIAQLPIKPNLNNSMCDTVTEYCGPMGNYIYLPIDRHVSIISAPQSISQYVPNIVDTSIKGTCT